jgi:hypothetical protein
MERDKTTPTMLTLHKQRTEFSHHLSVPLCGGIVKVVPVAPKHDVHREGNPDHVKGDRGNAQEAVPLVLFAKKLN